MTLASEHYDYLALEMNDLETIFQQIKAHLPPAPLDLISQLADLDLTAHYRQDGDLIIDAVLRISADCICANDWEGSERVQYKQHMISIRSCLQTMILDGIFSEEHRGHIDQFERYIEEIDTDNCSG